MTVKQLRKIVEATEDFDEDAKVYFGISKNTVCDMDGIQVVKTHKMCDDKDGYMLILTASQMYQKGE